MSDVQDSISFEENLAQINQRACRLGYVLVATLVPAGFTLDWITERERFWDFLWIRIICAAIAIAAIGFTYIDPLYRRARVLVDSFMPLLPAAAIELMIIQLENVHSHYYAGLNLVILAMAILFTWTWRHALVVSGLIFFMWALPGIPMILDGTIDWPTFFSNSYFLSLTVVIATASVAIRYAAAKREFDARRALAETSADLAGTLEQLREADRLKSEFFANISHELRTPLTLVMAPVDELLAKAHAPEVTKSLEVVRRNASRLLRMIDDLLELARLEGGRLRLNVASVDLTEIAERVTEMARPTATRKKLTIGCDATGAPEELFGDPHRVEIILTNLIGNALKFTPEGGRIDVRVARNDEFAVVEVSDDGPGIPDEVKDRIFERFYQVHGSERRRHGGAGIGLALARELAQLHDGDLEVVSHEGKGSTFRLSLRLGREHFAESPIERRKAYVPDHPGRRVDDREIAPPVVSEAVVGESSSDSGPSVVGGRRHRVLVAEDEEDLREFIAGILSPHFDVTTTADGAEALAMLHEESHDLVLTDVMMPGTSGMDLCRSIKEDATLRSVPVIMLTARSSADATLEGYAAGADDFVAKPFHTQVLVARIQAQLTLRSLSLQLADRARLASAGTLAAGVAHEVRNPINAVLSAVNVLEDASLPKATHAKMMEVIADGVRRIDDVVAALDAHARPADGDDASTCDVRVGIESTIRLLSHRTDRTAFHADVHVDGEVNAPARAFNQALLNLLDNAVRAGSRNVWVSVGEQGGRLEVTVEDDGPGVPTDLEKRLFDPFVTSQHGGDGTGLGLYLSRQMARESGGDLRHERRPAGGARFILEVPRMKSAA